MMTIRQIERLWMANSHEKLLETLLRGRWEEPFARKVCSGSAIVAAALGMIRLDELNQSDAPVFGRLLRTVLAGQEVDGGWGDVAATAWALRALLIDGGRGMAIQNGMAYLAGLQQAEGIWPGIPIRRMPADPMVSAFVLAQLGDSDEFRRRVRFADAVNWFAARCTSPGFGNRILDDECRAMWNRARLRCGTGAISKAAAPEEKNLPEDWRAGDGIRTHDVSLGKAAFYH
jgi:hypothetical protein